MFCIKEVYARGAFGTVQYIGDFPGGIVFVDLEHQSDAFVIFHFFQEGPEGFGFFDGFMVYREVGVEVESFGMFEEIVEE